MDLSLSLVFSSKETWAKKRKKETKTHAQGKLFSSMMKKEKKEGKNDSHVLKIKFKGREIIQQGVHISISSTFHTLAHLNQIL
jgi:uncharacterized protein YaaR (DUF327 family)